MRSQQETDDALERRADLSLPRVAEPTSPGQVYPALHLNLLLTLPFLGIFLVQLVHHNMWRDELNAFAIAVASPTLGSLAWHIHFEGHPWLWYVLLWIVSKFTVDPVGMKVLEAFVGTAVLLMIGLGSPFSRLEKLLLFFCYFISFEYTVMSRMYGVMLLLMLVYLRERVRHPERAVTNGLLLGLMASTDVLGIILSCGLALEYGIYFVGRRRVAPVMSDRRFGLGAVVYAALGALSVWTAKTFPQVSWRTTGHVFRYAWSGVHLFGSVLRFVVLPYSNDRDWGTGHFWDPSVSDHKPMYVVALPLVLWAYWKIFHRRWNLLALMGFVLLAGAAFGHLIYEGSMRHFGVTFLAFLAGIWILKAEQEKHWNVEQERRLPTPAYILLGLTAIGGIIAGVGQWRRPFSNAEPAAAWLRRNHLETVPLVGTPDTSVVGIAELLHRPIYMLDCSCTDTYMLFSDRRDSFTIAQIPDRLVQAQRELHVPTFLYVGIVPLTPEQQAQIRTRGFEVDPLVQFTGAEESEENFFFYRMTDSQPI